LEELAILAFIDLLLSILKAQGNSLHRIGTASFESSFQLFSRGRLQKQEVAVKSAFVDLLRALDVDVKHWNLFIRNRLDYLLNVRPVEVFVDLCVL
jgi:hypothetical protein